MQLARLVITVDSVRATTKKSEKVRLLAETLRETRTRETELAALYLSGSLPQGKIGIGWNVIQKAIASASAGERLTLLDVDVAFDRLATEQGIGSTERRVTELSRLFSRSISEERRFLSQLLIGEIRQGALEGLLLEAIAKAAGLRRLISDKRSCLRRTSALWRAWPWKKAAPVSTDSRSRSSSPSPRCWPTVP